MREYDDTPFVVVPNRLVEVLPPPPPPSPSVKDKSINGLWRLNAIRSLWEKNAWLGDLLEGMKSLAELGLAEDGVAHNFNYDRVAIGKDANGNCLAPTLGPINEELVTLKASLKK